jgi:hypothetical protein
MRARVTHVPINEFGGIERTGIFYFFYLFLLTIHNSNEYFNEYGSIDTSGIVVNATAGAAATTHRSYFTE